MMRKLLKLFYRICALIIVGGCIFTGVQNIPVDADAAESNGRSSTYYMPGNFKSLKEAFRKLGPGDTLIIRDGVYSGADNTINRHNAPPSGIGRKYTAIRAQHPGRAIFDGENERTPVSVSSLSQVWFDGLVFKNSDTTVFSLIEPKRVRITRCGFGEAGSSRSGSGAIVSGDLLFIRRGDEVMVKDCFTWGNGRYRYYFLDSNRVTVRRSLDRFDRGQSVPNYDNMASFRFYNTHNSTFENCLVLDGDQGLHYVRGNDRFGTPRAFWFDGRNNSMFGCVGVNNPDMKALFLGQSGNNGGVYSVRNSAFWGFKEGIWTRETRYPLWISHCTIGKVKAPSGFHDRGIESDSQNVLTVMDSLIFQTDDNGLRNSSSESDHNNLFKAHINSRMAYGDGAIRGRHDMDVDPNLKYLLRHETGSRLKGSASDGGVIGATLDNIWPWPNEDMIHDHLCSYYYRDKSGNELRGNRGFCSSGKTLTTYVWEILGNNLPPGIYQKKR